MTHFARKLRYGAYDGDDCSSFTALIEFALKKGGPPSGFAIYYRIINHLYPDSDKIRMLRIEAKTADEANKFWPWGWGAYKRTEKKFPGFDSDRWEKTTGWLDRVALGHEGIWVRVGSPSPCSARRRKKLQFGNISQILRIRELQLAALEQEYEGKLRGLQEDRSCLEVEDSDDGVYVLEVNREEHTQINREIAEIQAIFDAAKCDILATRCEMRYMVRQKFPEPLGKLRKRDLRSAGLLMSPR